MRTIRYMTLVMTEADSGMGDHVGSSVSSCDIVPHSNTKGISARCFCYSPKVINLHSHPKPPQLRQVIKLYIDSLWMICEFWVLHLRTISQSTFLCYWMTQYKHCLHNTLHENLCVNLVLKEIV